MNDVRSGDQRVVEKHLLGFSVRDLVFPPVLTLIAGIPIEPDTPCQIFVGVHTESVYDSNIRFVKGSVKGTDWVARPGRTGPPSKNVYRTGQNVTPGAYEFVIEQKNAEM